MRQRRIHLETIFYIAIFLLAIFLRLSGIGQRPLSDPEANLALQTLALSRGESTQVGPQPAYLALTTAVMFLFAGQDWTARFWPAVAGSLLVLLPMLYRKWLGRLAALFMALFLAVDPSLLAASLQADGLMLAMFLILLTCSLIITGRAVPAGIAAGMAILGGPAVWPGAVSLGLAVWLTFRRLQDRVIEVIQADGKSIQEPLSFQINWRWMALSTLISLFLGATLFFFIPRGLSASAGSLSAYISGWFQPSGVSVLLLIQAILLYEFMPLFLGLWGGFGGLLRNNILDRFFLVWWAISLGVVILYQNRQVLDVAWAAVPLAALAARQLARMINVPKEDWLPVFGQAALAALILGFISITVVSMGNNSQPGNVQEYWLRLAGALIMLFASAALIGWGWSKDVALRGFTWGLVVVLLLYYISAAWDSASLSSKDNQELWTEGRQLPEEQLMLETVKNLTAWGPVVSGGPDLVIVGVQSPALRWALRDHPKVDYTGRLSGEASPAMLITGDSSELELAATYRGQDFVLSEDTDWESLQFKDWVRWLVFRSLPGEVTRQDRVVLWARTDLFPGGALQEIPGPGDVADPSQRE